MVFFEKIRPGNVPMPVNIIISGIQTFPYFCALIDISVSIIST